MSFVSPWLLHPALVHFPIAFLTAAVVLDLYGLRRGGIEVARAATNLLVAGTVTMALAAAAGLLAFYTVPAHTHEAHDLLLWHLGINAGAFVVFAGLAVWRWRERAVAAPTELRLVGVFALALVAFAAYLGGEIVYRGGAGVDPAILAPEVRHHTHAHPGSAGEPDPGAP